MIFRPHFFKILKGVKQLFAICASFSSHSDTTNYATTTILNHLLGAFHFILFSNSVSFDIKLDTFIESNLICHDATLYIIFLKKGPYFTEYGISILGETKLISNHFFKCIQKNPLLFLIVSYIPFK